MSTGNWETMVKKFGGATGRDVAEEVGVSRSTVSNAFNRPDQLSGELREKVLEASRRLGYPGPNPLGRSLKRMRSDAVGLLFGGRLSYAFADPASVMFMEGVAAAIEDAGLVMLLLPGESLGDSAAIRGAIDGLVIHTMASDDPLVPAALEHPVPAVIVDQPPLPGMPSVSVDDEGAAREAAEHVLDLGHRSLAVISFRLALRARSGPADIERQKNATLRPSAARLEGYASATRKAGLAWEEVPVYECSESAVSEGRAAARSLLGRDPRPTAILATSDQLAFGVYEAAAELGLSIPGELSIVGFDDIPEAGRANPPLTTVSQPHTEKGLRAGKKLVAMLEGEDPGEPEVLSTRFIARGSTAKAF